MFSGNKGTSSEALLNAKVNSIPGYHTKVRVLFHENQHIRRDMLQCAQVKFVARHKTHPAMEAILTLTIKNNEATLSRQLERFVRSSHDISKAAREQQGLSATVKSIHLRDPNNDLANTSESVVNAMISALLRAAYEYGEKRQIDEWKLNVAPFFKKQLSRFGIKQQNYGSEVKGRDTIGVNPYQFIHAGKQVIELWNRRLFDYTLA